MSFDKPRLRLGEPDLGGRERFTVSVVICCHDARRLSDIREAVASVRRQSIRPDEIVLVVDHNERLYRELLAEDGITRAVLNARVQGLSATRNVGVSVATSEVVAFIDDDAVAKDDWLSQLLRPFSLDPNIVAVGGKEVPFWMSQRPIWWANELDWVVGGTYTGFRSEAGEVRNVHGGNMAFRRSILLLEPFSRVVGHDRNLISGDETELCLRVRRRFPKRKIWYEPGAVIYHKVPRNRATLGFALRRSYGEGIGKGRILRLHAGTPGLLSPELQFLRSMLFEAIPRKASAARRGAGLFQVGAIIASATAVGLGYLVGLLRGWSVMDDGAHYDGSDGSEGRVSSVNLPAMPSQSNFVSRVWIWYRGVGSRVRAIPIWRLRLGSLELGDWVDGLITRFLPAPREPREVVTHYGFRLLFPAGYRDFQVYESGIFEGTTSRRFAHVVRAGALVVDAGAHVGYYTILASRLVGRSGQVVAFEPDPAHFCSLQGNIKLNGCENVHAINAALGSRRGKNRFFSQPSNSGSSLYRRRYTGDDRVIEASVISLDEFVRGMGWPRVDIVKIDIEGGEKMALEGMRETVSRNPTIRLFIEFELRAMHAAGVRPVDIADTLSTLGFARFALLTKNGDTEVNLPSDIDRVARAARREGYVNVLCEPS